MNDIIFTMAIVVLIVSAVIVFIWRCRLAKTYNRISDMIDSAMHDKLIEREFTESRLSALETKMCDFLSASKLSARNVNQEKDRIKTLISDISHQTKTPIANLLLYCELLKEMDLSEEAMGYVELLYSQTEKLKFLIDALVKLSRLENGVLALKPSENLIGPVISKIVSQYSSKATEKGLALVFEEKEKYKACFDSKWTEEAIGNIVDNAIKYTDFGSVEISLSKSEIFLRIDIKDTGIGISEEEQTKVFGRFYRSVEVCEKQGVGLGLYLAREIILAEDGFIKLTSTDKVGTVFSVYLPTYDSF